MGTDAEILTGLSEGERVVGQGAGFLDDGDRVRIAGRAADESPEDSRVSRNFQ